MSTYEIIEFDELEEEKEKEKKPDDLASTFVGFLSCINYKLLFFLYIIFLFLTSDVFVDKILDRVDDAVHDRNPTTKGTFIQGLFLVLFYIAADAITTMGFV
jgi:hypothetical protein